MGCAFSQTDGSQRRDRKHDGRNAEVICFLMIPFQEICGHKPPFIACHRRQGWAPTRRSISRRINCRVGDTLQEVVYAYSSLVSFDARNIQIEVIYFWHAAGGMHNHVRLKTNGIPEVGGPNDQFRRVLFDSYRFGPKMKVNAEFARSLN